MRLKQRLYLAAFLALLISVPAYAQKISATIRGTVTDPTGAVIPGAKVTVKNEDTGLSRSANTTSAGIYSFAELPVGSYRVEVEFAGFKSEVRSRVVLNVADTRAVVADASDSGLGLARRTRRPSQSILPAPPMPSDGRRRKSARENCAA